MAEAYDPATQFRPGWTEIASGVGVPTEALYATPHVSWRHIDGPMMTWAGQIHWLTWRERFALWLGRTTVEDIAARLWPSVWALR